jgi:two-component system, NtrC family, response regulator HydG
MNIAHVLVVDDDIAVCRIVHRMLSGEKYEVRAANSVADGLKVIEQESFDAYVLDYKLKDGSGLVVAARIRAKWGLAPIILISGYDPSAIALRAQQLRITEFLQKPFSRETICEVVNKAIESSSSAAAAEFDSEDSQTKKPLLMRFIPRLDESKVPWKE